jgi:hypothetical protein
VQDEAGGNVDHSVNGGSIQLSTERRREFFAVPVTKGNLLDTVKCSYKSLRHAEY